MRRAGVSALLIVCVVTFLCPAIGKPIAGTETKAAAYCSQAPACKIPHEHTPAKNPCGDHESQPQPRSCCTVSCSSLILFCSASDRLSTPRFNGHTFAIDDTSPPVRMERPPTPPPRI